MSKVVPLAPRLREAARLAAHQQMVDALRMARRELLKAQQLMLSPSCSAGMRCETAALACLEALLTAGEAP